MIYLTDNIDTSYLKRYANSNGQSLAIKLCIVMNIDIGIVMLEPQLSAKVEVDPQLGKSDEESGDDIHHLTGPSSVSSSVSA